MIHSRVSSPISRRRVLRGAGALVSLPFLEAMHSVTRAGEDARPPLRMVIFTVAGGTVHESWNPRNEGVFTGSLPSILKPLEPFRDELLIISGLSNGGSQNGPFRPHEFCSVLHLTAAPSAQKVGGRFRVGISVDQAAARAIGRETILPSLELGLTSDEMILSFSNADTPVPYQANPRLLFDKMFRGKPPITADWRARAARRATAVRDSAKRDSIEQSVLDLVSEQARGLQRSLGTDDRRRLDEYLESVRSLETRVDAIDERQRAAAGDILKATLPAPPNLPGPNTPLWKITTPLMADPEYHAEYIRLISDLMILALRTDTTRVITLAVGSDEAFFPGVVTVGYERHAHTLQHFGNSASPEDSDPIAREACRQMHAWYTGLFAETVAKMKAIDEGGHSLLSNCLVLYTSYMSHGNHGTIDYPVALVGNAQGTLKPGRHLAFPRKTPVANLFNEMLERVGSKEKGFGDSWTSPNSIHNGRLPGLV